MIGNREMGKTMLGSGESKARVGALGDRSVDPSLMGDLETFVDEFVQIARDMGRVMRDALEPICASHGLSQQQALLLLALGANPGVSMGEASEELGILRTNFTLLVHKLEDRGLVVRTQDARDRRSYALDLTEEGRGLVASMQEEFARRNAHVAEAVTPALQDDLQRGMRAVKELVSLMRGGGLTGTC